MQICDTNFYEKKKNKNYVYNNDGKFIFLAKYQL